MILRPAYKHAAKVAASKVGRYAMHHLRLQGTSLVATDGRCLVVLPVERDEHDADGFVTQEALAAACKAKGPRGTGPVLIANGDLRAPFGNYVEKRPTEGEYPRWEAVVPTFKAGDPGTATVTFDPELLAKVAACMTSADLAGVSITFRLGYVPAVTKRALKPGEAPPPLDMTRADVSPILVRAAATPDAVGVVMPMEVSE